MNISQKCNCCLKESVCKYKTDYQCDCERLKQSIQCSTTEISIKCKEFGLECFNCIYYNKYSNYCTKFKIWSAVSIENKE